MKSRSCLWLSVSIALTACSSTPTITYKALTPTRDADLDKAVDAASPPPNGFAFSIRSSILMFVPLAIANDHSNPLAATNICVTPTGPNDSVTDATRKFASRPTTKKSTSDSATLDSSNMQPAWMNCVNRMGVAVSPTRMGQPTYVGIAGPGTSIVPTPIESDPLLLKSIVVNYKNPTPGLINSVGTAAAGGLVWGPWGAVAGALVVFVPYELENNDVLRSVKGGTDVPEKPPAYVPGQTLRTLVCKGAISELMFARYQDLVGRPPYLELPIAISDPVSKIRHAESGRVCWTPLPRHPLVAGKRTPDWFYRVVDPDSHDEIGGVRVDEQVPETLDGPNEDKLLNIKSFAGGSLNALPDVKRSFFVTACRTVKIQVTWWQVLDKPTKDENPETQNKSFTINVADPSYVQIIALANGRTINLGAACGGFASYSPPSTNALDDANAAFTSAAAFEKARAAQDKANGKSN